MKYLIKSHAQLEDLSKQISAAKVIAVDTEFLREKTYNAKLCLIQLGIGENQFCIDVLAIDDLSIIRDMLQNTNVIKLFHAVRQDMEVLYQAFGILPKPIFDTQLAAAFCGSDMQIGYAGMVDDKLDIQLPKSQARTDWSKRPLTDEQLEYAAADVKYLEQLYHLMVQQLRDTDRLDWFLQEIETYYDIDKYVVDPELAYQRLSGGFLALSEQAVLKALARWRETTAQKQNIPRNWVLRDDVLYGIAKQMPRTAEELKDRQILNGKVFHKYAAQITQICSSTMPANSAIWSQTMPLDKQQKAVCSQMMKVVQKQANKLKTAQGLLATRKDIERLFREGHSNKLLNGWRKGAIGDALLVFLQDITSPVAAV